MISGWLLNIKSPRITCLTHEERSLVQLVGHDEHFKNRREWKYRHCSKRSIPVGRKNILAFCVLGIVPMENWQALVVVWSLMVTLWADKRNKIHSYRGDFSLHFMGTIKFEDVRMDYLLESGFESIKQRNVFSFLNEIEIKYQW